MIKLCCTNDCNVIRRHTLRLNVSWSNLNLDLKYRGAVASFGSNSIYIFGGGNESLDNNSTRKLNTWLKNVTKEIQHPLIDNKKINFKYAVQIKQKPVTIKIFCNFSCKLKNNYKSYLINNFNKNFKILNQKTKFIFSSSKNPFV